MKLDTLRQHLSEDIIDEIYNTFIPINNIEDKICWKFTTTGIFSVKSATWSNTLALNLILRPNSLTAYGVQI